MTTVERDVSAEMRAVIDAHTRTPHKAATRLPAPCHPCSSHSRRPHPTRSQGYGRYTVTRWDVISAPKLKSVEAAS